MDKETDFNINDNDKNKQNLNQNNFPNKLND